MSNIINFTDYNTYFSHPIPFFEYIKGLISSQETPFNIIQKIQKSIHNIDNGVNGYINSTTMAFNTLPEYNELKSIIISKQTDLDKIMCLKLFFNTIY
jgi:hypothetical protein